MNDSSHLESILKLCADSAPAPWYPSSTNEPNGLGDDDLETCLMLLRQSGLVVQTEPGHGYGRGYVLSPEGVRALRDPSLLKHLGTPVPGGTTPPIILDERGSDASRALRRRLTESRHPLVTYALIALNILVYVIGAGYLGNNLLWRGMSTDAPPRMLDSLHSVGSLRATDLLMGKTEWLRLISYCFVHFGLIHLILNMISLYLVGPLIEGVWGRVRFLAIYLLAALGGSSAAMLFKPVTTWGDAINYAGASGALWGLMGSLAVWIVLNWKLLHPNVLNWAWLTSTAPGKKMLIAFVLWGLSIVYTFAITGFGAEPLYGGAVTGALCGLLAHQSSKTPGLNRAVGWVGIALVPVVCVGALYVAMQQSLVWARVRDEAVPHQEAKRKTIQKDCEMSEFNEKLSEMSKLVITHEEAYKQTLESLLNKDASRRDPEAAKKAVAEFERGKVDLEKAAELLRKVGPFENEKIEQVRKTRLELLEARIKLFELGKENLEQGKDGKEHDETELKKQQSRVREIEARYKALPKEV
jgi:membrane associated rhomboid family serine protease